MPKFDLAVKYLPPEKVQLTKRAKTYLEDTHFSGPDKFKDQPLVPIFSIGVEEIWLGFDIMSDISPETQKFISPDGIIAAMPLSLLEDETVKIDYCDGKFLLVDLEISSLIPPEIRRAISDESC